MSLNEKSFLRFMLRRQATQVCPSSIEESSSSYAQIEEEAQKRYRRDTKKRKQYTAELFAFVPKRRTSLKREIHETMHSLQVLLEAMQQVQALRDAANKMEAGDKRKLASTTLFRDSIKEI